MRKRKFNWKRIGALGLGISVLLGGIGIDSGAAFAQPSREAETATTVVGKENIKDGAILHAFCWNFNTIKEHMEEIAQAGYTAVQTSPINECLDTHPELAWMGTDGAWYYHYQPTDWKIGNYQLGSRDEFKAMCQEADKYGIGVIVDILPNHTTPSKSKLSQDLIDAAGGLDALYHPTNSGIGSYGDRLQCTRYDMGGLPDVDTENHGFQQYFYEFLQDCIDCGADGFRIDTAKHIGLPDDERPDGVVNDFYPNMKLAIDSDEDSVAYDDLFVYGEVLQGSTERLAAYQDMLGGTTASKYGESIRSALSGGDLSAAKLIDYKISNETKGDVAYVADADKLVTWVESHDTYMNDGESWAALNDEQVKLGWAVIAARAEGTPLFFNRPEGSSPSNREGINKIGPAGNDYWMDDEVVAVNKFRAAMTGTGERLSNPDGNVKILMIERGKEDNAQGIVFVNSSDSNYTLNCPTALPDGTYVNMTADNSVYVVNNGNIQGLLPAGQVVVLYEKSQTEATSVSFYNAKGWNSVKASVNGSDEYLEAVTSGNGWWSVIVLDQDFEIAFTNGSETTETFAIHKNTGTFVTPEGTTVYATMEDAEEALGIVRTSVYFLNSELWDNVNAYAWIDTNQLLGPWPGANITYDGDYWYRADLVLPEKSDYNIIFNNGSSQTKDIKISKEEAVYVTVDGEVYTSKLEAEDAVQFSSRYTWVYYYNEKGWDEIAAYTWGGENSFGGWPGSTSAVEDDGDGWYKVKLEDGASAALYLILNNNGKGAQTNNINISDAKNVYIAGVNGKKYASKEAAEKALGISKSETSIYYYDKLGWDQVYAYAYIDGTDEMPLGGWPGTKLNADKNNWKTITIPAGASDKLRVIFNNGNGQQTEEYIINDVTKHYMTSEDTSARYSSKIAAEEAIGVPKSVTVVHFYNNDGWSKVSAYLYGGNLGEAFGGWPGIAATDEGDGWFSVEVPGLADDNFSIIFNNGGNGKQTADYRAIDQETVWCYMGSKTLLGSKEEIEAIFQKDNEDSEDTPDKGDTSDSEDTSGSGDASGEEENPDDSQVEGPSDSEEVDAPQIPDDSKEPEIKDPEEKPEIDTPAPETPKNPVKEVVTQVVEKVVAVVTQVVKTVVKGVIKAISKIFR